MNKNVKQETEKSEEQSLPECPKCSIPMDPHYEPYETGSAKLNYFICTHCQLLLGKMWMKTHEQVEEEEPGTKIIGFARDK